MRGVVELNRSASTGSRGGSVYLGSVRGISNEYGQLEERYEYDAFGKPYQGDFSNGVGLGYTGKPYDPTTGLYNYGYRDYQPEAARFTTVDPVRDGNNWFAYVNNDPVNWLDLWGLTASDKNGNVNSAIPVAPPGVSIDVNIEEAKNMNIFEFYDAAKNRGKWDYKQNGSAYEDFGNFNYGATGKAVGFPDFVLERAAGWAQGRAGTSKSEWGKWYGSTPYGDDPNDQKQIKAGIDYYNQYKDR